MFILTYFRIIPSFKYNWVDLICLLATCVIGVSMLYLELDAMIETSNSNFSAPFTFSFICELPYTIGPHHPFGSLLHKHQ